MSKDIYAFSDVHGNLSEELFDFMWDKLSSDNGDNKCYFLGDYIDRGDDVVGTICKLHTLLCKRGVKFVFGNHDEMLYKYLDTGNMSQLWAINGGYETLAQLTEMHGRISPREYIDDIREASKFYYYETIEGKKVSFSHSGMFKDTWAHIAETIDGISPETPFYYNVMGHWGIKHIGTNSQSLIKRKGGMFTVGKCPETGNPFGLIELPTHSIIMIDNADKNNYVNVSAIIRELEGEKNEE